MKMWNMDGSALQTQESVQDSNPGPSMGLALVCPPLHAAYIHASHFGSTVTLVPLHRQGIAHSYIYIHHMDNTAILQYTYLDSMQVRGHTNSL